MTEGVLTIQCTAGQPAVWWKKKWLQQHFELDTCSHSNLRLSTSTNDTSSDSAVSLGSGTPSRDFNDTASTSSSVSHVQSSYEVLEGATGGQDYNSKFYTPDYERAGKFAVKTRYDCYDSDDSTYDYCSQNSSINNTESYQHPSLSPHPLLGDMRQVNHNHTYHTQPGHVPREVKAYAKKEQPTPCTPRDEKRAKTLKLPISVSEIIYCPVEELNALVEKHSLNDQQMQLVKDIRRRGKNKLAAQNCRKRKLEEICDLEEVVNKQQKDHEELMQEHMAIQEEMKDVKNRMSKLYNEVFSSLRDRQGNPYDPRQYRLDFGADGMAILVPTGSPEAFSRRITNAPDHLSRSSTEKRKKKK